MGVDSADVVGREVVVTEEAVTTPDVDFEDVFCEGFTVNVLFPFTRHSIEVFEEHGVGLGTTEIGVVV